MLLSSIEVCDNSTSAIASHSNPSDCLPALTRLAKDLTTALAVHLADLVANYVSGILVMDFVLLFNQQSSALLQASYWVRPIFEELLYTSSHAYQGTEKEARGVTG